MEATRENKNLRSPKNKKQIGRIGKGDKIYIEDYAVTYLNQIARAPETQGGFAGLFGTCREIDGKKEYYIYAAVYQESDKGLEGGLPKEAVKKIMRQRAEMFVEYFFLGWALVIKENNGAMWESCYRSRLESLMGKPELLMTLRCKTCEEHFYLYPTEMPKETEGYFIFYEQNDAMQNFLIDWHGTNHKDKCDEGDEVAESCRNYYKEKKAERFRARMAGVLLTAAAFLLIFSAGVGIQNLNNYEKIREAGHTMDEMIYSDSVLAYDENSISDNYNPETIKVNESNEEILNYSENNIIIEDTILVTESENDISDTIPADESADEGDALTSLEESGDLKKEEISQGEIITQENEDAILVTETLGDNEANETAPYITYEVCKGDTLYGICVRYYGNLSKVSEICALNQIENMDNILYGEKILLPQ